MLVSFFCSPTIKLTRLFHPDPTSAVLLLLCSLISTLLQSTASGSVPCTWPCDGVCIDWQSCCSVSQVVWWLSVCQTKRGSHRCSWHGHQAAPSSWSFSHSKIISWNWPLYEGALPGDSLEVNVWASSWPAGPAGRTCKVHARKVPGPRQP